MDDRTQGALLLAVGGVSLRLGLTDAALAYVKAGLQPLLVAAGIVLVVLGAVAVWRAFRGSEPTADAAPESLDPDALAVEGIAPEAFASDAVAPGDVEGAACAVPAGDGHGDHAHGPIVAWLLVLPLLALLLVAPPPLGAFAAGRQSARPPVTTQTSYPPLPAMEQGAVPLTMSEYVFRALYDPEASLDEARIRLTGFVTPDEEAEGYLLTRFMVSCCAADGQAVSVEILDDPTPRSGDTWLEVEGYWEPRPGQDPGTPTDRPPLLVADTVTPIEAPTIPYEY